MQNNGTQALMYGIAFYWLGVNVTVDISASNSSRYHFDLDNGAVAWYGAGRRIL